MGGLSIWHWLIVLVIVLLIFGTSRLKNVGGDLGKAINEFKKSMNGDDASKPEASLKPDPTQPTQQSGAEPRDRAEP